MAFRLLCLGNLSIILAQLSQLLTYISRFFISDGSVDYITLRDRFIKERSQLLWQLIVFSKVIFAALESYGYLRHTQQYIKAHDVSYSIVMSYYGIAFFCLIVWQLLHRFQWSHQHPIAMFLGLSLIITLPAQFLGTIYHLANPDFVTWTVLFPAQSLLVSVCWRVHALSQIIVLAYFLIVNTLLGFLAGDTPVYTQTLLWWWMIWLCGICDLSVFLFERLRQSEFESRRELQIFLHAVSHDLRTPVVGTSIVLQNLLKKSGEKIMVRQAVLDRLIEGSDRQLALIDTLMNAHCIDKNMRLDCEPIQLSEIVRSVLSDLSEVLSQNQIQVINNINAELPLVDVDKTQIWRVLNNLISNAVNHNPPRITLILNADIIEVQQPSIQSMIQCRIQDNGIGIAPTQQQRLFELYSKGSRARYMKGLGLGLYLCRQIIHAHGGKIGVNSRPGEGSTFWFTLPLATQNSKIPTSH
ncbi:MAG TPA: HAMP domain-containing sensor histidine kinase [Phormidium sp.]